MSRFLIIGRGDKWLSVVSISTTVPAGLSLSLCEILYDPSTHWEENWEGLASDSVGLGLGQGWIRHTHLAPCRPWSCLETGHTGALFCPVLPLSTACQGWLGSVPGRSELTPTRCLCKGCPKEVLLPGDSRWSFRLMLSPRQR